MTSDEQIRLACLAAAARIVAAETPFRHSGGTAVQTVTSYAQQFERFVRAGQ